MGVHQLARQLIISIADQLSKTHTRRAFPAASITSSPIGIALLAPHVGTGKLPIGKDLDWSCPVFRGNEGQSPSHQPPHPITPHSRRPPQPPQRPPHPPPTSALAPSCGFQNPCTPSHPFCVR